MLDNNPWPSEPSRRKVILVLKPDDFVALQYDAGGTDLMINEEVYVMPWLSSAHNSKVQELIDKNLVMAGAVLIQDPFDKDIYHREPEAIRKIAKEKWLHFSTLCSYLGARKIEVKTIRVQDENGDFEFKLEGEVLKLVKGQLNTQKTSHYSFLESMFVDAEFKGGDPDIHTANEFLQNNGLIQDIIMKGLLNKVKNYNNKLTSFIFKLDLTNEAHQNFKILAGLGVTIKKLKLPISLEAKYTKTTYEKTKYTLRISVKF